MKPFHYDHMNHVCSGHCHEKLTWANIGCQLLDYWMATKDTQCFPSHIIAWYHLSPECPNPDSTDPWPDGCYGIHHFGSDFKHTPFVVEVDLWQLDWDGKFGMAERLSTPDEDGWEFFPA